MLLFPYLREMEHIEKETQKGSGVVLLRPYQLDDVNHLYEAARESIAELSVWMPWCHSDYSINESRIWVESQTEKWGKGTDYNFTIIDSGNGLYLGGCGLNDINRTDKVANLGYWVRTGRTGQGVATEAALLLARFGFDKLKLNRIEIIIATGNVASHRVAEKIGATREGILRNRFILHDTVHHAVMLSLTPGNLNTRHEYNVKPLCQQDHAWVVKILEQYWGSTRIVVRGMVYDADQLPGFIALHHDRPVGLITYRFNNNRCEIVTLNSLVEGKGVGSALLEAVKEVAISTNYKKLWLITTNDNTPALSFYQKKGFLLVALHRNALEHSRKLKPEIPIVGINGIPLRDEIELELLL